MLAVGMAAGLAFGAGMILLGRDDFNLARVIERIGPAAEPSREPRAGDGREQRLAEEPGQRATEAGAPRPPEARAPREATRAELTMELEALRRAVAAEQAKLDRLVLERTAAEAGRAPALPLPPPLPATPEPVPTPPPAPAPAARQPAPAAPAAATTPPAAAPAADARTSVAAIAAPRLVIHFRAGSAAAEEAAQAIAASLRDGGFGSVELRGVAGVPSQRVVRYFSSEAAGPAARLAGRLGRGWSIQDFRGYDPSPSNLLLEVWLPDR